MALNVLPEKGRGGKPILTLNKVSQPPANHSQLPGIEQVSHSTESTEIQRFEAWLWDARNEWSIRRRANAVVPPGRLHIRDADKAMRNALHRYVTEGGGR